MTNPGSPRIEMLWEAVDPQTTLTDRFGFADSAAAARWVAGTVQRHWDLEVVACERIVLSVKNALAWIGTPDGRMLVKWSIATRRFARLAELAQLTWWLAERRMPVSAPLPARDDQPQVELDGVSVGVQHEMRGALLDVADAEEVHSAGVVLARLHRELSSYPSERISGITPPHRDLTARITGWLDKVRPQLPDGAAHALRRRLADAPAEPLPTQLVHGDFRAANVLMTDRQVAAVLDFEEVEIDHRIVELARSAVLLGTRFHDWGPVCPDVRASFLDGYRSVCRLTDAELCWWDTLVLWFTLAMVPPGDDPTGWAAAARALVDTW